MGGRKEEEGRDECVMIDYLLFTGRTDCVRACSFGLAGGGGAGRVVA